MKAKPLYKVLNLPKGSFSKFLKDFDQNVPFTTSEQIKAAKPVALIDEESKPNPTVIDRFDTIQEAVDKINEYEKTQPDKVHRGGFGIDAPEDMLN